ncbi:MAG: MFS transporter [Bacteroidia bacterium]|jgi:MFS family permease|nr:MFS transporter [Bacteroidia bacterium]
MQGRDSNIKSEARVHAHPVVFLFLVLPFGILGGYVSVAFAYLYSRAGVSVDAIAALIAASLVPHIFKFLWAPLVDTTLSLKKWYILSCLITAAGILSTIFFPVRESSLAPLTFIMVVANTAVSFLGIATNGLAAHDTPEEMKGRVGGYSQAGNLGGAGLGGGAGLWLAQHLTASWMPATIIAISCLACCTGLFFIKEPPASIRSGKALETISNLFKDLWVTIKARLGFLALFLCFLPLGTGAASNLWAAIATDWKASSNTVALVTGVMGGIVTAAGCLAGGWICDRMNRQRAYMIFGLMQAACAAGMAYSPRTEIMYIIWTTVYAFTLGFAYAAFSAFVFEAIGKGAAGTKFTVYACLSNIPIYYMTLLEGWGHSHYGAKGMLLLEALAGLAAVLLFMGLLTVTKKPEAEGVAG